MKFNIISLFPEFFSGPLGAGLMQRAVEKGLVEFSFLNPRDFTNDKRQTVDDRPYGGGPGMVMLLEPLAKALLSLGFAQAGHPASPEPCGLQPDSSSILAAFSAEAAVSATAPATVKSAAKSAAGLAEPVSLGSSAPSTPSEPSGQALEDALAAASCKPGRLLAMSPRGRVFDQAMARELAAEESVTIICGRYEGFDARLFELFPVEEVSVGDFVLNGGEIAALALTEATARLLPGFMGHDDSGLEESFSNRLLEYPHYTRPENYAGLEVPEVLRCGDHARIERWRREESLRLTLKNRPDLLAGAALDAADLELLREEARYLPGKNLYSALIHYPVLDKEQKSTAVSLTNLDVHDIARSSCAYGLAAFFVVTPLEDQLSILGEVLGHWTAGAGGRANPDRRAALAGVRAARSLEEAVAQVREERGVSPLLLASSARPKKSSGPPLITFDEAGKIIYTRPAILLLGTGHGLAPELLDGCDYLLPPLR
ncbi:hypothetical protein LJC36_03025, partial [Desulfovibrio sp. OttesenSCG-928-C14]|nr:hypothetical protein [Desulfovibrio sp. OttesenSCG-928-C14]